MLWLLTLQAFCVVLGLFSIFSFERRYSPHTLEISCQTDLNPVRSLSQVGLQAEHDTAQTTRPLIVHWRWAG
jgi:hypothetical protein